MDISDFRYLSKLGEEQWSAVQNHSTGEAQKTTSGLKLANITDEEERALLEKASQYGSATEFAQALLQEIDALAGQREDDLSEMMKSTSGRKAIIAMSENKLTSTIFGTLDDEDASSSNLFDKLLNVQTPAQQDLAQTIQSLLEKL